MKKIMIWFVKLTKRQLKKPSFYIIILLMSVTSLGMKYIADNYSVSVKIGIVNEDDGGVAEQIEKSLYSTKGMVVFEKYDNAQELRRAVENKSLLGGYVIKKDFSKYVIEGKYDKIIETYMTPDSIVSGMANEVFFSYVMEEISYEELVRDTADTGYFPSVSNEEMRIELRKYFDENISNGNTFDVKYENAVEEKEYQNIDVDIYDYMTPVIGKLVAVLVFAAGLCGTVNYYDDRESGAFSLFKTSTRQIISLVEIAIPVVLISVAGIVILVAAHLETLNPALILKYLKYDLIVIVYCYILKSIIHKKEVYVGMVPALLLMSLVFCPVFVNIGSFAKGIEFVGRLLPLYYY